MTRKMMEKMMKMKKNKGRTRKCWRRERIESQRKTNSDSIERDDPSNSHCPCRMDGSDEDDRYAMRRRKMRNNRERLIEHARSTIEA